MKRPLACTWSTTVPHRGREPVARPVFGDIPDLVGRDFDEVIHVLWPKA